MGETRNDTVVTGTLLVIERKSERLLSFGQPFCEMSSSTIPNKDSVL